LSAPAFNTDDAKDAVVICIDSVSDAVSVNPFSKAATECSAKLTASEKVRLKATSFWNTSDTNAVSESTLLIEDELLSESEEVSENERLYVVTF